MCTGTSGSRDVCAKEGPRLVDRDYITSYLLLFKGRAWPLLGLLRNLKARAGRRGWVGGGGGVRV